MAKSMDDIAKAHRAGLPSKGVRLSSRPVGKTEQYGPRRRSGVEGTYGAPRALKTPSRGGRRNAEKTVYPGSVGEHDGSGRGPAGHAAKSIYGGALRNAEGRTRGGDKFGDKALYRR